MTTKNDPMRFLCLLDELETSRELLRSGFGHLQEIDMGEHVLQPAASTAGERFRTLDEVLHRRCSKGP